MANTAKKTPLTKTKMKVQDAGLVGFNWKDRHISKSVHLMPPSCLHDLQYWLDRHVVTILGPAKPNGRGWTHLVSWPGWGIFVIKATLEKVEPA